MKILRRSRARATGVRSVKGALLWAVLLFLLQRDLLFASPAPVTRGLTFALSFDARGRAITSGPFVLRVPGTKGSLKVEFDSVGLIGGMLDAPLRLKNESGVDLLAVRVDLTSASESVRREDGASSESREVVVSPGPPLAWDAIRAGAETPADLFRGGPFSLSKDSEVLVVLGVVSGLAPVPANPKADVRTPASKASACPGAAPGCRVDAEGNVWRIEPAFEGRRGGLSQRTAGGAVVRSLTFAAGENPVDLSLAPDGRLLVFFDGGGEDRAVRAFRPF